MNNPVTVLGTWNRNGTSLTGDVNRITVMSSPMSTPPYASTIRIDPLGISDAGMYTCVITVTPENDAFITGITYSISRNITIGGTMSCLILY